MSCRAVSAAVEASIAEAIHGWNRNSPACMYFDIHFIADFEMRQLAKRGVKGDTRGVADFRDGLVYV
jgi:hypothetical protein